MASRQYLDPTGTVWEVFDVQRLERRAGSVSEGYEHGWLAFVSAGEKRRLAVYPPNWSELPDGDLQALWMLARPAPAPRIPVVGAHGLEVPALDRASSPSLDRRTRPRIRRAIEGDDSKALLSEAVSPSDRERGAEHVGADLAAVERLVRAHAARARADGLPAVQALVSLKRALAAGGADSSPPAMKRARGWFVEAFYLERKRPSL